jgi:hypothetical protein
MNAWLVSVNKLGFKLNSNSMDPREKEGIAREHVRSSALDPLLHLTNLHLFLHFT